MARRGSSVRADVLLTHFHVDHIQGFPFFEPLYDPGSELRIHGPAASAHALESALMGVFESIHLPIPRSSIAANLEFNPLPDDEWRAGPFRIASYPARHPNDAVGFRIRVGETSMAYVPDNELVGGSYGEARGWYRDLAAFLKDVDLLLHDATYTDAEYTTREGWGHSTLSQAVRLAQDAGANRLLLFHHAPGRSDADLRGLLRRLRRELAGQGSGLELDAAREAVRIELRDSAGRARPRVS